ncbi:DUF3800 domain-containing protein [Microbacterium sp. EYE_5]|uniref:DUF3800 domain-containing protein n=1 Tax=unclassified Microbacterium TaxID=2609290 RepID=UPI002004A66D|nr:MULTISPECIES: DUF3800 domain-containing protein [unclassified Microbacterium]MCK6081481.1 DUF3800 domain-containing protein [Microbacterium sp. EYE_382]MCK6086751.1 DUF3800 domain-containing protein [Microbacterium sp. EYE_384]MCK6123751.1 DUF3800 domain-containing protein [Microbacterium sp. EYE_80]MCK6126660.1 DUF3800 domain-containing protein [Microbacterium sp. EYE_79]MCK6142436.1 DUF3800 domain-containing protein [Microbacterium sp. EYE_39]
MHFAFADDTKQRGLRDGMGQLLALGAVVFPEDQLRPFSQGMSDLRSAHSIPADVELKWSMPAGAANYFRQRDEPGLQDEVRRRTLELAAEHGGKAVVVVFDLGRTTVQGRQAEAQVLKYLYERIVGALERTHMGVVVFDKPGGDHRAEDTWIAETLTLTNYGTEYVDPDAIVLPILTAPSHHHEHLQLADLVVGAVTAACAGNRYGMQLVPSLLPLLHRNALNTIGGAGLKVFPDTLTNLYFHVLGEDTFWKVAGRNGYTLPSERAAYYANDGL